MDKLEVRDKRYAMFALKQMTEDLSMARPRRHLQICWFYTPIIMSKYASHALLF